MYTYKKLEKKDFKLLFKWMNNSHIKKWWDTDKDFKHFKIRYGNNILNPLVHPHIVYYMDKPIGFINYWYVEEDEDFKTIYPRNTVGTDQFIGESSYINKGHGQKFIKKFTDNLLKQEDINLVITDPDIRNTLAISCYKKAGFMKIREYMTREGLVLLMEKS